MAEPPPLPPGVTQPPLAMTTVNQQQLQGLHPPLSQASINVSNSQQQSLVQHQTRVVPTSVVASSAGHHVLTTSASGHHVLATINQVCKLSQPFYCKYF